MRQPELPKIFFFRPGSPSPSSSFFRNFPILGNSLSCHCLLLKILPLFSPPPVLIVIFNEIQGLRWSLQSPFLRPPPLKSGMIFFFSFFFFFPVIEQVSAQSPHSPQACPLLILTKILFFFPPFSLFAPYVCRVSPHTEFARIPQCLKCITPFFLSSFFCLSLSFFLHL